MVNFVSYNQVVTTTISSTLSTALPTTDTNFKVFRGTKTVINFTISDNDRQLIDLTNQLIFLNVFNYATNEFQFKKDLIVVDPLRGNCQAIFDVIDTIDLIPGFFYYSLTAVDNDVPTPYFMDTNANALSYFELVEGVMPAPMKPVVVKSNDYTPTIDPMSPNVQYWAAGPFKGDANQYRDDGLHTVAFYCEGFTGEVAIQVSLNESPMEGDWSYVWIHELTPWKTYDNFTGAEPFNFRANVKWVRFKFITQGGAITDQLPDSTTGYIKKIVYRN